VASLLYSGYSVPGYSGTTLKLHLYENFATTIWPA